MSRPLPSGQLTVFPAALQDIRDILDWSEANFGREAKARYRTLIKQALHDIEADPTRPEARIREDLAPGARIYHLASSRHRVIGTPVQSPRHFVLFRTSGRAIEIARILHDSRDLPRHLPE